MDIKQKVKLLSELLEVEVEEVKPEKLLDSFAGWDSMTALSLIAMLEEHFDRSDIDGSLIKKITIVQDILNLMEK